MEFGEKMTVMRYFRKMSAKELCELTDLLGTSLALVADGTMTPSPVLEKRIRIALGWPAEVDELLEIIHRATYKSGEGMDSGLRRNDGEVIDRGELRGTVVA
jgi:hypothetical protein